MLTGTYSHQKKTSIQPQKLREVVKATYNGQGRPQGAFYHFDNNRRVVGEIREIELSGRFNQAGRYEGEWLAKYKFSENEVYEDRRVFRNGVLCKWINRQPNEGKVDGRLDSTRFVSDFFAHYDSAANVSISSGRAYSLDFHPDTEVSVAGSYSHTSFNLEKELARHLEFCLFACDEISHTERIERKREKLSPIAEIIPTHKLIQKYQSALNVYAPRFDRQGNDRRLTDYSNQFDRKTLEEMEAVFLGGIRSLEDSKFFGREVMSFADGLKKSGARIEGPEDWYEQLMRGIANIDTYVLAEKKNLIKAYKTVSPDKAALYVIVD